MGNRIVGNFKAKLGQAPSQPEEEIDAEGKAILDDLRSSYKKLTDGVKTFPRQKTFKGDAVISSYTELCLIAEYVELEKQEESHFSRLGNVLQEYPIFTSFLKEVKGIGPAMAGVLLSEIDIHKAKYPSSIWSFAGLDVAPDGAGRSRRKEHLVRVKYLDKKGEEQERDSITFNPFLKTKLYVLASSFLRAGDNPYSRIYRDYKNRLENSLKHATWARISGESPLPFTINEIWVKKGEDGAITEERFDKPGEIKGWKELKVPMRATVSEDGGSFVIDGAVYQYGKSKLHRHNMASRYALKMFLLDLYKAWRPLEGLPVAPSYQEAKLGHQHAA